MHKMVHLQEWDPLKRRNKVKYLVKRNKKKNTDKKIWGLLTCLNKCGETKNHIKMNYKHNRDKNSCLNMEKIVEHIKEHNGRPKNYKRTTGKLS